MSSSASVTDPGEDDSQPTISDLVCIEYPGVVNSTEAMLDTLGGLDTLAQVLEEPNRSDRLAMTLFIVQRLGKYLSLADSYFLPCSCSKFYICKITPIQQGVMFSGYRQVTD